MAIGFGVVMVALSVIGTLQFAEVGDALPTLVLAGVVIDGAELEAFLRRTGNVGGTVELLGPVSESELARLYEFCDFTVFPSGS